MSAMMLRSSRLVAVRAAAAVVSRAAVALRAPVARFSAESDDAFKPKSKVKADDPKAFAEKMDRVVKSNPVTLFMKGTPQQPMCGFSAQVVRILNQHGVDIHGVNVLENPDVRQGMKDYSNWPTFPQLYVNGEFVGGCDIVTQMHQSGELKTALEATKGQKTAAA